MLAVQDRRHVHVQGECEEAFLPFTGSLWIARSQSSLDIKALTIVGVLVDTAWDFYRFRPSSLGSIYHEVRRGNRLDSQV